MSDRADQLRQSARAEAIDRALRFATARKTTGNTILSRSPQASGFTPPAPGETTCGLCGVRSGVGCKHTRRP
ncbi:hypothetical protein [Novosphingobium sp. FSW06-99]|uniref:hypothetical protein n=1 Tax=Novosphingobium sp. FSW06-99 TaxID=1739113 RepID=UPI00076C0A3C|nr:hypothetical protein [Novosphingobium sp. FSW06-99]KUR80790.1 hypothetical protein AQZ49_01815 [Novosphingobium sp. FSW06-99]